MIRLDGDNRGKQLSPNSFAVMLIVATTLMSVSKSVDMIIGTYSEDDKRKTFLCNVISKGDIGKAEISDQIKKVPLDSACYDVERSDFVQNIVSKMNNSSDAGKKFKENYKIIISILQSIGFFFFIRGWIKIYNIADGKGQQGEGYGASALIIFFSTFIIDLPNTIDGIVSILQYFGFLRLS